MTVTTPPPPPPDPRHRPGPPVPQPPPVPSMGELGKDMARDLGHGLLEIGVWLVAVVVVVGGLGLVGHLVAGGTGLLVGVVAGVVALGVLWLVLMIKGASLASGLVRRERQGR